MEKYTFEQLPTLIGEMRNELTFIKDQLKRLPAPTQPKQTLFSEELLPFLAEHGVKWSASTLNKNSSLGKIPYKLIGKRRVFDRATILIWIAQGCPNVSQLTASQTLAETVRKGL
jgi:hypothetical protein